MQFKIPLVVPCATFKSSLQGVLIVGLIEQDRRNGVRNVTRQLILLAIQLNLLLSLRNALAVLPRVLRWV
jgi:hypothetical protein